MEESCHSCFHWRDLDATVTIGGVTVAGSYIGCTQNPGMYPEDGPCGCWAPRGEDDPVDEQSDAGFADIARELYAAITSME